MMRLIRQLFGKGRREAQAEAMLQAHQAAHRKQASVARANVRAIENLLSNIEKDITSWH